MLSANGVALETVDADGMLHSSADAGPARLSVLANRSAGVAVRFDAVTDGYAAESAWQLSLAAGARSVVLNTTGGTNAGAPGRVRAIRHSFPFTPASIYALFDRGVVQTMAKKSYYISADNVTRLYALGQKNASANPYSTNTEARNLSVALRRAAVAGPGVSGLVVLGSMADAPFSSFEEVLWASAAASAAAGAGPLGLDSWSPGGLSGLPGASVSAAPARWTTRVELAPNNADFPAQGPLGDVSAANTVGADDLRAMLTGIYGSPVGQLCTHDNAIVRGKRVGQMATTIGAPGYGYCGRGGCSYNFFDPDSYLSTSALLYSGDPYLHDQVRTVLERSGSYLNADGALPHHFNGVYPTYASLTGMAQTGPNIFWVLSCFNYAKFSGDAGWLAGYMPKLRNASSFISSKMVPAVGLYSASGSLMIDVFIRSNFTADTNAVAVGFWREFADAEEAVGNRTGARALRMLADSVAAAVNRWLWSPGADAAAAAPRAGDHYVTQVNPDGSTRDFVDYDANFIALAYGVPATREQAAAVFSRIAGGACPHARGGWVSEKYYGRKDCQRGITGDSWCAMGRISWFNALARKRYGDQAYFDREIQDPLVRDVLRYTWMHERAGCDGTPHTNRTPYYFEFPSVTAMAVHYIRYGIQIGLLNVTISPFGPTAFIYSVGTVHVDYSAASVNVTVPGQGLRTVVIDGLTSGAAYTWRAGGGSSPCAPASGTTRATAEGSLAFRAPIGTPAGACTVAVTRAGAGVQA